MLPVAATAISTGGWVLVLDQPEQTFVFDGIDAAPVHSLMRGFSAPVILDDGLTDAQLLALLAHDTDAFNRVAQTKLYVTVEPINLIGLRRQPLTAVIEERVDRLLQHALFVAHDDVGRIQLEQPLETIVPVDDPPIKVVKIGGRKTATVQRHQRTQVRRQHG